MTSRSNSWLSFLRRRSTTSNFRNHDHVLITPIKLIQLDETDCELSPYELTRNGKLEELKTLAVKTQNQCLLAIDRKGRTLLHVASESGRTDIMHYLISSGVVNLNAQDEDGSTALHLAVDSKHTGTVDLLLKCGAISMIKNRDNDPPLHIALRSPALIDITSTFAKYPISLTVRGHHNYTLLHVIAEHDNLEALEVLHSAAISRHQDSEQNFSLLHAVDDHGMTPIHLAARKGSHRVLDFMISESIQHGALTPKEVLEFLNEDGKLPLHFAVESGHLKVVEVLLKYGATPVATKGNHLPPIHLACSQNRLGMVKAMVQKFGPDILKCCDQVGQYPLHSSISSVATTDMFTYLLENGAELDALDHDCHTPLHDAVIEGNSIAVGFLLERGSNPLIKSKPGGHNCLHSTVLYKRKEAFKTLMNTSCFALMKNDPDSSGNLPVHLALNAGLHEMVLPLLQCENVSQKDKEGNNYLHLAALAGDYKSLLCVLSMECSDTMLNELNLKGQSPLHLTAISGSLPIIKEMIDRGAVVQRCHGGQTPFMYACSLGKFEAAEALYQSHPFQRDWFDNEGNSALHLAIDGGDPDTLTFCLDTGMVITLNNTSRTFLDRLLNKADEMLTQVTVKHERWQECLDVVSAENEHPVLRMIARIPSATLLILDRCVEKSTLDSHNPNYWEEYNFKYLILDPEDCNPVDEGTETPTLWNSKQEENSLEEQMAEQEGSQGSEIHGIKLHIESPVESEQKSITVSNPSVFHTQPHQRLTNQKRNNTPPLLVVKRMVEYKHKECLTHPVVVAYLNSKWNYYARWVFLFKVIMFFVFALFLSAFIWITPPPLQSTDPSENITDSDISVNSNVLRFVTIFLAGLNTLLWIVEAIVLGWQIFTHFTKEFYFWSSGISLLCTYIFLIPWRGLDQVLWEAGVFSAFFAWIALAFSLQLFDLAGIYVTMLISTTKNVLKVLLIVFLFVCAFAFPIHILVGSVARLQYPSVELSIFSIFHTLITAVDYPNIVALENLSELRFSVLVFIFFIALLIMMPIVVINLLIGIAVGDIANILQQAIISRRTLEVDSLSKLDKLLPKAMLERFTRRKYKKFPNQNHQMGKRLLQKLIHSTTSSEENYQGVTKEVSHKKTEQHKPNGQMTQEGQLNLLEEKVEQLVLDQAMQMRHMDQQMESLKRVEEMLHKLMELQGVAKNV